MASNSETVLDKVETEALIDRKAYGMIYCQTGMYGSCQRRFSCYPAGDPVLEPECHDYLACDDSSVGLTIDSFDMSAGETEYYGLCAECQNRSFCSLKDISGGVWHCDEYL